MKIKQTTTVEIDKETLHKIVAGVLGIDPSVISFVSKKQNGGIEVHIYREINKQEEKIEVV